jgi:hypothetical protein
MKDKDEKTIKISALLKEILGGLFMLFLNLIQKIPSKNRNLEQIFCYNYHTDWRVPINFIRKEYGG